MNVVVSGFPAFSGVDCNPTAELIRFLQSQSLDWSGVNIRPCLVPVDYQQIEADYCEVMDREQPDLWLAFGVGRGTELVRIEQVAVNQDDSLRPDNAGEIRLDQEIVPGGPEQITSREDLQALQAHLAGCGFDAVLSHDAGRYLCNHIFYYALHSQEVRQSPCRFLFLHVAPASALHPVERLVDLCQEIVRFFSVKGIVPRYSESHRKSVGLK